MNEPVITDKKPTVLELEPGSYYWCSCGKSQNQFLCDGSHQDTQFLPLLFEINEKKNVAICNCKHTANPPYCDGVHAKL